MRNAIKNALSAGLKLLEGSSPPSFIYRNGRYPCVPTTERRGLVVVVGGAEVEITGSLIVRKDAVPAGITADADDVLVDWNAVDVLTADADANPPAKTPYAGRRIGKNGQLYRIVAVREDPVGSHWTLDLGDPNR